MKKIIAVIIILSFFKITEAQPNKVIKTGDDCDEINLWVSHVYKNSRNEIDYDENSGTITFTFGFLAGKPLWWKQIDIPLKYNRYKSLKIDGAYDAKATINKNNIDFSKPIRFWKAKFLGTQTLLDYRLKWDEIFIFLGKQKTVHVSFIWAKDKCN